MRVRTHDGNEKNVSDAQGRKLIDSGEATEVRGVEDNRSYAEAGTTLGSTSGPGTSTPDDTADEDGQGGAVPAQR